MIRAEAPGPHSREVVDDVVDDVELRPAPSEPGERRFEIIVGRECVGWLKLSGGPRVTRLTGEVFAPFRGRGVATAAVAIACRVADATTETRVLEAFVPGGLGAAHRVLEANGFAVADVREEPCRFELTLGWSSQSVGR